MILQENPNNIYFKINFTKPEDYMNEDLTLLNGIYPKCIQRKESLHKYIDKEKIQTLEDKGFIAFYKNNKLIKWKSIN